MNFPYTSEQIREIVKNTKVLRRPEILRAEKPLPFESYGERGRKIDLLLDLADGPSLVDLRFQVRAPIFDNPETFEAALILASQRIRGIGWNPTGKKRLYGKQVIPKGWHLNVIDPNLPRNNPDFNRHLEIPDFVPPTDLADLFTKAAKLWHIDIEFEKGLL